jgi:phosphoglycerate dehydrogenase-like enzyme
MFYWGFMDKKKIVVTQDLGLYHDQIERLKNLGDVKIYNDLAKSYDEWLERCEGVDIICTSKYGLKQRYQELKNVFLSLPFVGVGFFDREILKQRNIKVSNCPGCNKDAVSEWVIGMMINLLRKLPYYINNTSLINEIPKPDIGLTGKKVCILGKGNIGSRVGKICEAFEMEVGYFLRGDDLIDSVKGCDIVVNCLGHNPSTENLLDKRFFKSLKKGVYFISVTGQVICDINALIEALDSNIIAGAAIDVGWAQVGNTNDPDYKKIINHSKLLATPHMAYNTDVTDRVGNDMMINNIELWLKNKPINLVE